MARSAPGSRGAGGLPLLGIACFDPTFPDGTIHCTIENDCPPGFECLANHFCYALGSDAGALRGAGGVE